MSADKPKKAPAPESKKAPPSASKEAPPFPSKKAPAFAAFISYAKDDFEKAQEIADQLEEHDFKCWIAPRDVRPGRSYGDLIIKGIERATVLHSCCRERATTRVSSRARSSAP